MKEFGFEKNKLQLKKNHGFIMDENHTHFILVDDGTDDNWQTEIELRALLESKLREGSENHHKDNGTILLIEIQFSWLVSNLS